LSGWTLQRRGREGEWLGAGRVRGRWIEGLSRSLRSGLCVGSWKFFDLFSRWCDDVGEISNVAFHRGVFCDLLDFWSGVIFVRGGGALAILIACLDFVSVFDDGLSVPCDRYRTSVLHLCVPGIVYIWPDYCGFRRSVLEVVSSQPEHRDASPVSDRHLSPAYLAFPVQKARPSICLPFRLPFFSS